jgi:hypothetical protein
MTLPRTWTAAKRIVFRAAVLSAMTTTAFLAQAADLKGLSVDIVYFTQTTYKKQDEPVRTTVPERRVLRFYISTKGKIFQYSSVWSEKYNFMTVLPLGHAAAAPKTRGMVAFAIINGKITKLIKEIHGLEEQTITISPDAGACELSLAFHPDSTGRIVSIDPISKKEYEQLSRNLLSYKCDVKRGNIFSNDN